MNPVEEKMKIIASLKRTIINHTQFNNAFEKLHSAFCMNQLTGAAEHIICVGQSGTGKSTLKEKIRASIDIPKNSKKVVMPVLIVNTPSLPTVKNLAEEMLINLGDMRFYSGSAIQKTNRVLHYLKMCEVKMIIIDELQHFIDRGSVLKSLEVSDWLKTVIDQSGASIVLMGLERCEYLFRINEQLRRRFSKRISLYPFTIDTPESYVEFVAVIAAVVERVGVAKKVDINNKELVSALYYATAGIIGNLIKLFVGVYELQDTSDLRPLDMQVFEMAFTENIWHEGIGNLNPFNKSFIWEKLDKPQMPFHITDNHGSERLML